MPAPLRAVVLALATTATAVLPLTATPATAATPRPTALTATPRTTTATPTTSAAATPSATSAASATALRIAAAKKGSPYQWGATGPYRFDCSGLTLYAFQRAGTRLPRTAEAQYHHATRISPAHRQRGDLVFFHSGGTVYHVGIYAGRDRIWHAPRTGTLVRLERIWSPAVSYGRVA